MMPTLSPLRRAPAILAALILSAGMALAQDTAAPAADTTLSMGAPADAVPALKTQAEAGVGELYSAGIHGDWDLRCVKTEDGSDPCRLYQLLRNADGTPTAEISLFNLPEGQPAVAGAAILVPLDTLLSANLTFAVDANREMVYPYSVCGVDGCIARVGFSADQLTQMKAGAVATLTLVPAGAPDQRISVAISLKGFTAAFDAVTAANTPN